MSAVAAEVDRLRDLVGPSERSYMALRRDVEASAAVAREATAQAGELRGRLTEMSVELSRARQDLDVALRHAQLSPMERLADRIGRRWSMSVVPRARRLTGRT